MIDFELTEDHKAIQRMVREFAQREVAPYIKEWDEKQHFERSVLDKMAELGLLGICIPEEYGGAGFDYISLGLACEELEAVDTFLRVIMSVHVGLNSLTLLAWGTEEQKQKYLVPQARGEKIATYGLTEPGAGSDVVGIRSTARREGDEYVLNGEKMWISLADVADHFLFFCWTDEEKRRKRDHSGISCFIVERGMKGFSSGTIHGKMGIRAGNTGYFSLQDVRVPKENLVGEEGEGFKIAMFALEQGRYTVAAGATGVIRACRDASIAYALARETFGTKIANHQLVKQKIAEMEADYQMCRLLYLRAGWMKNVGLPNARATSLAKWQATVRSEKAASMAIEVHGANGYSNDYPVERYFRNCKAAVIYEGTRDIHTLMQADWVLGLKQEKPARKTLPPYRSAHASRTAAVE
ncbi:acyl-CoA dehydrogenase family protein [Pyrinomonas methylaliphatogenes]|uniref:Acyl-CoA dehydrogenase n=1 Tax=Pyrinomonas methylaliphatogenes TaxID=454194 RepID=A0A0B6WU86_9BACT|nr:acyl-CoA dehydrogenase family protein [Pyrinomonas methylaliphatogenes]CDM64566.1 acyl-CoA dehydrogenase [Pyrinomonas methylaliphatogenes]